MQHLDLVSHAIHSPDAQSPLRSCDKRFVCSRVGSVNCNQALATFPVEYRSCPRREKTDRERQEGRGHEAHSYPNHPKLDFKQAPGRPPDLSSLRVGFNPQRPYKLGRSNSRSSRECRTILVRSLATNKRNLTVFKHSRERTGAHRRYRRQRSRFPGSLGKLVLYDLQSC